MFVLENGKWYRLDERVSWLLIWFGPVFKGNIFLTDNVATLFRGTSAATSLMDQYMKMVAVPYVQLTLRDVVVRIMECKHSCEVSLGTCHDVTWHVSRDMRHDMTSRERMT